MGCPAHRSFGSNNTKFSRQDIFKPTSVTFEGESGVDVAGEGGLSVEMLTSFWRGVMSKEVGLFESVDRALPRHLHRLIFGSRHPYL